MSKRGGTGRQSARLGLQLRVLRQVGLEHVEQEARRLADHVALEEHVGEGVEVHRRRRLLGDDEGELHGGGRVHRQEALQQVVEVRRVARLLAVGAELVHLAAGGERLHHLLVGAPLDVDLERRLLVERVDEVAELLGALELVLGEPAVEELLLVLGDDQLGELEGLEGVELALLEARAEVEEERALLAGLRRGHGELRNRLAGAEHAHRGVRRELRGPLEVASGEQRLELGHDELLSPRKVPALGDGEGEVKVLEGLGDEGDHRLGVDVDEEDLAGAVDGVEAAGGGVAGDEDGVGGDAVAVDGRARLQVVDEDEAELRDHVHEAVLVAHLAGGEGGGGAGRGGGEISV